MKINVFLFCQFVKFANIEEDTPSYHRSYDFFVSRFSEMCHSNYEDPDIRTKLVDKRLIRLLLVLESSEGFFKYIFRLLLPQGMAFM